MLLNSDIRQFIIPWYQYQFRLCVATVWERDTSSHDELYDVAPIISEEGALYTACAKNVQ